MVKNENGNNYNTYFNLNDEYNSNFEIKIGNRLESVEYFVTNTLLSREAFEQNNDNKKFPLTSYVENIVIDLEDTLRKYIHILVKDTSGNSTFDVYQVEVDITAPSITISEHNLLPTNSNVNIEFTLTENQSGLESYEVFNSNNDTYEVVRTLSGGSYLYSFIADENDTYVIKTFDKLKNSSQKRNNNFKY